MKKRLLLLIAPVIALILECLPNGVIMTFADGPNSTSTATYSYFGITPVGYAMYGPFLAAVMTCVIIILSLVYVFTAKQRIKIAILVLSAYATAFSVLPLPILGIETVTVINAIVAACLLAEAILALPLKKGFV